MVATPARIGFVTRASRRAVATTPEVEERYGSLARVTDDPLDTYFSTVADAQYRANERQALFAKNRRLFTVAVSDIEADEVMDLLDAEEAITARVIDPDRGVDMLAIVTEVVIDGVAGQAQLKCWG